MAEPTRGNLQMAVLSSQLERAVDGRRVRAGVFLTHNLDPAFFEQHVLSLLFQRSYSTRENVKLAQLEDELRGTQSLAVYYDRRELDTTSGSAHLPYERIPLARTTGKFHAKNVFLLLENPETDAQEAHDSLLVVTTSANLTRSGWWENAEVAHFMELKPGDKTRVRGDLIGRWGLLNRIMEEDHAGSRHLALEVIRDFVTQEIQDFGFASWAEELKPRLFFGQSAFPSFLNEAIPYDLTGFKLEIISPFFDNTEDAKTLRTLMAEVGPEETRIFLPRSEDIVRDLAQGFYEAASKAGASWARLPSRVSAWSSQRADDTPRFVHAKIYRLFHPKSKLEYLAAGSVNLTRAAHSEHKEGNFETAILVGGKTTKKPDWWLTELVDKTPREFQTESPEKTDETALAVLPIHLFFDWRTHTLRYLLEEGAPPPPSLDILSAGSHVASISNPEPGDRIALGQAASDLAAQRLRSSAFFEVRAEGKTQVVLVREENMERKPPFYERLNPEEILEYWSTLTTEQRDAILDARIQTLLEDGPALAGAPKGGRALEVDTMFDRFAGIFHAFTCLHERVERAIETNRLSQASSLLFGNRIDSLPTYIKQLDNREGTDPVNEYVSLLCAKDLCKSIQKLDYAYIDEHREDFVALDEQLAASATLAREQLDCGLSNNGKEFLDWFEATFSKPVKAPQQEGADA